MFCWWYSIVGVIASECVADSTLPLVAFIARKQ